MMKPLSRCHVISQAAGHSRRLFLFALACLFFCHLESLHFCQGHHLPQSRCRWNRGVVAVWSCAETGSSPCQHCVAVSILPPAATWFRPYNIISPHLRWFIVALSGPVPIGPLVGHCSAALPIHSHPSASRATDPRTRRGGLRALTQVAMGSTQFGNFQVRSGDMQGEREGRT